MANSPLLTHIGAIERDWLDSGISPNLIHLNRQAVKAAAGQQLEVWIENFTNSFRESRLKRVLSNSTQFCRQPVKARLDDREISGLTVELRSEDWRTFKYLASKVKTLRYRIEKIDPATKLLLVSDPHGEKAIGIIVQTGEIIFAALPAQAREGVKHEPHF